jgi:hypothetical protein
MVYGRTQYWYSWTAIPQDRRRDFLSKLGVQPDTLFKPPQLQIRFLQDGGLVPCICSVLIRREIVNRYGAFDETIQHMYEDQILLSKLCLAGPVLVENNCGEKYRQHPDSSSYMAIQSGEYHPFWPNPARLSFLRWLAAYVEEQGYTSEALLKLIQRELWLYQHPFIYRVVSPIQFLFSWLKGYGEWVVRRIAPVKSRLLRGA